MDRILTESDLEDTLERSAAPDTIKSDATEEKNRSDVANRNSGSEADDKDNVSDSQTKAPFSYDRDTDCYDTESVSSVSTVSSTGYNQQLEALKQERAAKDKEDVGQHNPVFLPDDQNHESPPPAYIMEDPNILKPAEHKEVNYKELNPDLVSENSTRKVQIEVADDDLWYAAPLPQKQISVPAEHVYDEPGTVEDDEEGYSGSKKAKDYSLSRRKDWEAFADNDDDDSDFAEHLFDMSKNEPGGNAQEENPFDFGYVCCPCSSYCIERKLNKVGPLEDDKRKQAKKALENHLELTRNMEISPPEGRKLFFCDGLRRVDYILVYNAAGKDPEKEAAKEKNRTVFERNLVEEGLEIEHDTQEGRELQYVKVHAPWEVLSRYAEIMKLRMPIKEVPEEIQTTSIWELLTDFTSKLMSPFELNPIKVPPMPKKFTHVFERDKEYLFAIPEKKELFFSHAQRSRIVDYILRRKKYSEEPKESFSFGIKRLLANGSYTSAYPLHEGSWKPWTKPSMRRLLYEHWARWKCFYKLQPLDYIRVYFGEKIGLYFAWLGFYTYFLIPASVVGLVVFIYGIATMQGDIVTQESCHPEEDYLMCPKCDRRCPYWNYSSVCFHVRSSHLFDNGATVFFSIFMSLWGVFFLEFWKREQACIQFKWNLMNFQEEEEPPRPEYLIKLANSKFKKRHRVSGVEEPFVPFWRRKVPIFTASFSVMCFLCLVAIAVVVGVIVFRMAFLAALYAQDEELVYKNATMITSAAAACINLVFIFILNYLYSYVAVVLTDWECLRTQTEYDSSLTFKLYTLQFVNYYSSLFYIAFFKGRFPGSPDNYNTLFGARQEECSGGGCLIELCIQLAIIFVGKQLIQNNLMEILLPRIKKWIKSLSSADLDKAAKQQLRPWEKDYILEELGSRGLFNEYLEMLIQFGFVTLFVAAFPLAPLFALLNNIIEIRADANKFVTQLRRPMAVRAENIGVWYDLLQAVSRISILCNACIIAFTSSFISRLVYSNVYSEDGSLRGYVNNSLSYFNVSDFQATSKPIDPEGKFNSVEICRYRDYRVPPWEEDKYTFTTQFWHVVAAQFIFIVIFENVVIIICNFVASLIPDMPRKLREQVRRENYLTNEIILKTELKLAKNPEPQNLTDDEMTSIRRRANASIIVRKSGAPLATLDESDLEGTDADRRSDDVGGTDVDRGTEMKTLPPGKVKYDDESIV